MGSNTLIEAYLDGAKQLREGVAGLSRDEIKLRPIAGKWSVLEVVCHVADFEIHLWVSRHDFQLCLRVVLRDVLLRATFPLTGGCGVSNLARL